MGKMLDQWMQTYGPQLFGPPAQSGAAPTSPVAPPSSAPRPPGAARIEPYSPGDPADALGPQRPPPQAPRNQGQGQGQGFADLWAQASPEQKQSAIQQLEAQGVDVADAYQRETGMDPRGKRKEDMAELLYEFGLGMLQGATAAPGRSGTAMAGLGAGLERAGTAYRGQRAAERQAEQQEQMMGLQREKMAQDQQSAADKLRVDLLDIATKMRGQDTDKAIAEMRANAESGRSRFYSGEDGTLFEIDGGEAKPVLGPDGQPFKPQVDPEKLPAFAAKQQAYLDVFGTDEKGEPLPAAQMRKVRQDALMFAQSTRGAMSEQEINAEALRFANNAAKVAFDSPIPPEKPGGGDYTYDEYVKQQFRQMKDLIQTVSETESRIPAAKAENVAGAQALTDDDVKRLGRGRQSVFQMDDGSYQVWTLDDAGSPKFVREATEQEVLDLRYPR